MSNLFINISFSGNSSLPREKSAGETSDQAEMFAGLLSSMSVNTPQPQQQIIKIADAAINETDNLIPKISGQEFANFLTSNNQSATKTDVTSSLIMPNQTQPVNNFDDAPDVIATDTTNFIKDTGSAVDTKNIQTVIQTLTKETNLKADNQPEPLSEKTDSKADIQPYNFVKNTNSFQQVLVNTPGKVRQTIKDIKTQADSPLTGVPVIKHIKTQADSPLTGVPIIKGIKTQADSPLANVPFVAPTIRQEIKKADDGIIDAPVKPMKTDVRFSGFTRKENPSKIDPIKVLTFEDAPIKPINFEPTFEDAPVKPINFEPTFEDATVKPIKYETIAATERPVKNIKPNVDVRFNDSVEDKKSVAAQETEKAAVVSNVVESTAPPSLLAQTREVLSELRRNHKKGGLTSELGEYPKESGSEDLKISAGKSARNTVERNELKPEQFQSAEDKNQSRKDVEEISYAAINESNNEKEQSELSKETSSKFNLDGNELSVKTDSFDAAEMKISAFNQESNAKEIHKSILTQTTAALVSEFKNFSVNQEVRTLHLRLNPETLGTVDLKIQSDGKGNLSATMTTEHEVARHTLSEGIAQLRQELEQAGFHISSLNVNIQQHQGSNSQMQQHQKQESFNNESAFGFSASDETQSNNKESDDDDRLFSARA